MRSHIVIFMGLPGAGKTTLALELAAISGGSIVSRDLIRDAMFKPCTFTSEEKNAAFGAVCESLLVNCRLGRLSIVDGMTFARNGELEQVADIAAKTSSNFYAFHCDIPIEIAQSRVERDRLLGKHVAADRDANLVASVAERFRTIPQFVIRLDMQAELSANLQIVAQKTGIGDLQKHEDG